MNGGDTNLGSWVKDIDRKQDEGLLLLRELQVKIEHMAHRMDNQCDRNERIEGRVAVLEGHKTKVVGELSMLKWIGLLVAGSLAALPSLVKWIREG